MDSIPESSPFYNRPGSGMGPLPETSACREAGQEDSFMSDQNKRQPKRGKTRRQFLKEAAVASAGLTAARLLLAEQPAEAKTGFVNPPLPPAPGNPLFWQQGMPVYSGIVNLPTGNLLLSLPICSWSGRGGGLSFSLVFNSQSTRSSALGPKWTHSYRWLIMGTSPAIVIADDGTETSFSLVNGNYVPPAGVYNSLVHNGDSTWSLTRKGGTVYHFNSSGLLTSIVDLNGNTVSLSYSGSNITTITDAANRTLQLGYTGSQLTSVTDCQNRVFSLSFDGSSRVNKVTDPLLSGQSYWRQMGYDSNNNVNALTNRLGKTWQYAFGNNNVFTSMTDPNNKTTSQSFAQQGGAGPQPTPSASDIGSLIGIALLGSWPSGVTVSCNWSDANSHSTQYGFDSGGHVLASLDANNNQSNFSYDASHNLLSKQLPSGATWSYTWDSRANMLTSTDPLTHQTVMTYDSGDRLLTTKDPLGHTVTNQYDSHGNLTSVTDALNETTGYTINSDGSIASVTDAMNRTTSFGYDSWGHRTSITDALNHVTSFVFDAGSHLTKRTDALNRETDYSYDAWGRLTGWSYPTTGNPSISLTLNAEGNVTQAVDGTGTRTYSYDVWNRPLQLTDPRGTTTATYDNIGNLLTQTDVTGRQLSYQYDPANRLTQVGDSSGNAVYAYTVDGLLNTLTYPNGVKATYGYDSAGRLTSLSHAYNNNTLISYAATYDNADRLTQLTEQPSGATTTFGYDNANRLTSESRSGANPYSGTYSYDASGLRSTAVVVTNGVTVHNGSYSYDQAGRLSQVVDTATQLTETYTWNNDGTLSSYPYQGSTITAAYNEESLLTSLSVGGSTAYQYGYAWDNARRWKKDIAGNVWTWYPCGVACQAGDLVEEQSDLTGQTWTTSALYLRGEGCGSGIIRRNSEVHHADPTGTIAVITNASGAIQNSNLYDRFGVLRYTVTGSAQTQWRWQGKFQEEEGLLAAAGGGGDRLVARDLPISAPRPDAIPIGIIIGGLCAVACIVSAFAIEQGWKACARQGSCNGLTGIDYDWCMINCAIRKACSPMWPIGAIACAGCGWCICFALTRNPKCLTKPPVTGTSV